jgi:hypothetical protein
MVVSHVFGDANKVSRKKSKSFGNVSLTIINGQKFG